VSKQRHPEDLPLADLVGRLEEGTGELESQTDRMLPPRWLGYHQQVVRFSREVIESYRDATDDNPKARETLLLTIAPVRRLLKTTRRLRRVAEDN
jgi:hypothetical protein